MLCDQHTRKSGAFRDRERDRWVCSEHSDQVGLRLFSACFACPINVGQHTTREQAEREHVFVQNIATRLVLPLEDARRVCLPVEIFGPREDGGQQDTLQSSLEGFSPGKGTPKNICSCRRQDLKVVFIVEKRLP